MSLSRLTLFNQAVSAAGGRSSIADPDENSREANLCRLWYGIVRDNVLQTGPWPSTTAHARLGVQEERDIAADWASTDPGPGWLYAYTAPADMLRPRFLHSYCPFERQTFNGATAIMANEENAILTYTKLVEEPFDWDNTLYMAVVFSLAAHITMELTKKMTLLDRLQQKATEQLLLGMTEVANEQHTRQEDHPTMLSIRNADAPLYMDRFSYPYATLNAIAA